MQSVISVPFPFACLAGDNTVGFETACHSLSGWLVVTRHMAGLPTEGLALSPPRVRRAAS